MVLGHGSLCKTVREQVTAYLGQVMHASCALDSLLERVRILLSTSPFCCLLSSLLWRPFWSAARRSCLLSDLSVTCSIATGGRFASSVNL